KPENDRLGAVQGSVRNFVCGAVACPAWLRELQDVIPALAILRPLDERLGLGRVAGAQVLVVPLDFLSGPIRDIAEVIGFRRPTGVLEIRTGNGTALLGVIDPLDPVAR